MGGYGVGGFGQGGYGVGGGGGPLVIQDLEVRVQDRLEEVRDGVGKFWSLQNELRPFIVEAMNVAMLITGEPQIRQTQTFSLDPSTTLFPMPAGALVLLRMEGAGALAIKGTTLFDLDKMNPGWQSDTGPFADSWFPFGLTQFGIHPQLTEEQQVVLTFIGFPITTATPYTGLETIPFQAEYAEALEDYASHRASLKEGGNEFQQSIMRLDRFYARMEDFSSFALRKSSLRFTRNFGSGSRITDIRER